MSPSRESRGAALGRTPPVEKLEDLRPKYAPTMATDGRIERLKTALRRASGRAQNEEMHSGAGIPTLSDRQNTTRVVLSS